MTGIRRLPLFLWGLLLFAELCTAADGIEELHEFQRLYVAGESSPPSHVDQGWQAVELKDVWWLKRRAKFQEAWYTTEFNVAEISSEEYALYIPRVSAAASFWINGTEIGTTGRFTEPIPRSWNHPIILAVPKHLLKSGGNRLDVRLLVLQNQLGFLYEMSVGPMDSLRVVHGRSYFAKVTATRMLTAILLASVVVLLAFYFSTALPKSYLWFALGSFFWSLYSLELCVREIPVSTRNWTAFYSLALLLATYFYARTIHCVLDIGGARLERFILILAAITLPGLLFLPPLAAGFWAGLTTVITAGIFVKFGLDLCFRHQRVSDDIKVAVIICGGGIIALTAYDFMFVTLGYTADFAKYPYIPLLVLISGGSMFVRQQIRVARDGETHQARTESAMQAALHAERSRLMQEIHDGVGGQLISTLAQIENDPKATVGVASSLRSAMSDLRLIVHSLDSMVQQGDVATILATVRERLEKGLNEQGITFDWRVQALPTLEDFGSEQGLQLMRIVQQAVANIIQHAHATRITMTSGTESRSGTAGIFIDIADNGVGYDVKESSVGLGIKNMRTRAERLGGALDVTSRSEGTIVHLWIPLRRSAA